MAETSVQFPSTLTESERFFVQFDIFKLASPLENIKGDTLMGAIQGGVNNPAEIANIAEMLGDIHGTFDYSQTADTLLYSIQLPLQESPGEGSNLSYSDDSVKTAANIGNIINAVAKGGGSEAAKAVGGTVEAEAMRMIPEVAQGMFGRLRGKVKNTMQQTFFEGPSKRDYSFSFELIARNESDSKAMSTIANRFQYFANPGLSGQGNFWTYPEVVRFFFMERDGDEFNNIHVLSSSRTDIVQMNEERKSLGLGNYESKACFITSVNIEYGDDDYLLFSSQSGSTGIGKMKLTLALQEVEYFSKEDYRRNGDPEIR